MLTITAMFASLLTLVFLKLSISVIGLRRKNKVSLGSGGIDELDRAIRAHGNFSEYVPLGLFLLGALELNGAPWALLVALGTLLVLGRFFHAKGIHEAPPQFANRVRGMKLTFAALGLLALSNMVWMGYVVYAFSE
jgi:uncharacterized membrane protein YecN with MAPEG domain